MVSYEAQITENSATWKKVLISAKLVTRVDQKDTEFLSEQTARWRVISKNEKFHSYCPENYFSDIKTVYLI